MKCGGMQRLIHVRRLCLQQWHSRQACYTQNYSQRSFSSALSLIPSVVSSFIDNDFVPVLISPDGEDNEHGYLNRSPASGRALCQVQIPSQAQVHSAITSSKKVLPEWRNLSSADRGTILNNWAKRLQQHQDHLVELEAMDTGIPVSQIRVNHIPYAIQTLQYYASLAIAGGCLSGRTFETPTSFSFTSREPLGVCAAIGAWNYPLVSMIWKVAPALACGNAIIYKPSECTPLTSLYAASLLLGEEDVLPPGILQVLVGEADTAKLLINHADIAKISVTGSVATGISVAKDSAATLKRTTLELGGKSALVIFADANLESAVRVAVEGNFVNNGQVCSNCTRVFVQQTVLDEFLSHLLKHVKESVVIGDNMMEDVNMGPLMMPPRHASRHYDRVMGYVEEAKKDSRVKLLCGGRGYQKGGGYFCEPTIFLTKSDAVKIVREEIFGPVMTVLVFDTEEEAVVRANATPYGLAAGVMTNDVVRALRVSKQLAAGNVWINNWNISPVEVRAAFREWSMWMSCSCLTPTFLLALLKMPFGGMKMSGYGSELGIEALQSYSQIKNVYMEMRHIEDKSTFFKPL